MTVSTLAELSKLSKSYISQVKKGIRPPSEKLLVCLEQYYWNQHRKTDQAEKVINEFLKSRRDGTSTGTLGFYRKYLDKSIPYLGLKPTATQLNKYINSLTCNSGGKHAYYRAISVFFNWLYSPSSGYKFEKVSNPIYLTEPPKKPSLILPSLSKEQVELIISKAKCNRDKAIIALFVESGLRLFELTNLKAKDIDWNNRVVRVIGKGNKDGYAPFGNLTEDYLLQWLAQFKPKTNQRIWNIGYWGIKTVLDELKAGTGLPCNPHTFRRTFACLLRKAGVDTMTIKDLGRWESFEMVKRYTRSVTFYDSLKFYKAPLS